jgi:hypothetical protein
VSVLAAARTVLVCVIGAGATLALLAAVVEAFVRGSFVLGALGLLGFTLYLALSLTAIVRYLEQRAELQDERDV